MRAAPLLAAAAAALALGSCGLRPVYGGGSSGQVATMLSAVAVAPIEGRVGWLVFNDLKERLAAGEQAQARFRLDVELDDTIVGLGIRGDRAITRERRTLRARYRLTNLATGETLLDATAGAEAGIDVVSSEYATLAAEQTAAERLSEQVADQIVSRLGLFAARSRPRQ